MAHSPALNARDTSRPSVSLIVCTVNRLDPLERLLLSLRAQTVRPLEIVIVDQNPARYLTDLLSRFQDLPLVHLVDLAEERGLSRARNLGLSYARGDLVGFPDDDCWYGPGIVAQVAALFREGGDLIAGRTSVSPHPARSGAITRETAFRAGTSNGLFVRRALALQVGGFDEGLGLGAPTPFQSGEASDFILRCLAVDAACRYEPDLVVHHERAAPPRPQGLRSVARGALASLAGGRARGARGAERNPGQAVFGLRFAPIDEDGLANALTAAPVPTGTGPRMVATANLDHIVQMSRNSAFRQAYDRAWTITADGMPVYLYARLRGASVPARVTGSDLFVRLMAMLAPERHRCFFVCSTDGVADSLERQLLARGFAREALGFVVPPYAFERDEAYSNALAARIREHGATHLFLGVGAPKSDLWTDRHRDSLGDCYVLNIGAALDFQAGTQRRAPVLMRRIGLEWAWRVARQPKRLYRRYFVDSWRFLWLVARDLIQPARMVGAGGSKIGAAPDA